MRVTIKDQPFEVLAVGWPSRADASAALARLPAQLGTKDLDALAVEIARELGCLRGSFVFAGGGEPVPGEGVLTDRLRHTFLRPARGTKALTAGDVAARLGLRKGPRSARMVGTSLRELLGAPRRSQGRLLWDVPNVWGIL